MNVPLNQQVQQYASMIFISLIKKEINSATGESIDIVPARCLPVMFPAIVEMDGFRGCGVKYECQKKKKK